MAEDTHKEGSEEEKKDNSQQDEDFGLPDLEFEELEELDLNMDESETERVEEEEEKEESLSEDMLVGSDDIDMSVLDDIEETKPVSSSLDQGIDEIEDVLDSAQLISDRLGDEDEDDVLSEIENTILESDSESVIEESSDEKTIDDFSVEGMSTESVTGLTDEELEALMTPPEPVPDVESILGGTSESSDDLDDLLASIDSPDELAALGLADVEESPEVNEEQVVESSLFAADDIIDSPVLETESSFTAEPESNETDTTSGGSIFESDTSSGGSSIFESDSIALEATPSNNESLEFQKPEEASLPSDYKPYTYDEANSGNFAKVIVIGVVVITLIGFGLLYFSRLTGEEDVKKIAKKENTHKPAAKKKAEPVTAESDKISENKTVANTPKEVVAKKKVPAKKKVVKPSVKSAAPGEIVSVSERTGRVYVIIASFIDGDIAMDYAEKLSAEGKGVKIIAPYGKSRNYRVTISDYASVNEATSSLPSLKSNYGEGVWALKY